MNNTNYLSFRNTLSNSCYGLWSSTRCETRNSVIDFLGYRIFLYNRRFNSSHSDDGAKNFAYNKDYYELEIRQNSSTILTGKLSNFRLKLVCSNVHVHLHAYIWMYTQVFVTELIWTSCVVLTDTDSDRNMCVSSSVAAVAWILFRNTHDEELRKPAVISLSPLQYIGYIWQPGDASTVSANSTVMQSNNRVHYSGWSIQED